MLCSLYMHSKPSILAVSLWRHDFDCCCCCDEADQQDFLSCLASVGKSVCAGFVLVTFSHKLSRTCSIKLRYSAQITLICVG